jgi:hypothetical protein
MKESEKMTAEFIKHIISPFLYALYLASGGIHAWA